MQTNDSRPMFDLEGQHPAAGYARSKTRVKLPVVHEFVKYGVQAGLTPDQIADGMNSNGWVNRAGKPWSAGYVERYLEGRDGKKTQKTKASPGTSKVEALSLVFSLPFSDRVIDKLAHIIRNEYA